MIRKIEDQRFSYDPRLLSFNEADPMAGCQYHMNDGFLCSYVVTHPLVIMLDEERQQIYGHYVPITQRFLLENSTFEKLLPLSPRAMIRNSLTVKVGDFYRRLFFAIVKDANPLAYDASVQQAAK